MSFVPHEWGVFVPHEWGIERGVLSVKLDGGSRCFARILYI